MGAREEFEDLTVKVNAIKKNLTVAVARQDEQIEKFGAASAQTGDAVTDLVKSLGESQKEMSQLIGRLDEVELRLNRPGMEQATGGRVKSMGDMLIKSDFYNAQLTHKASDTSPREFRGGGSQKFDHSITDLKDAPAGAIIHGDAATGGAVSVSDRDPVIYDIGRRAFRLSDLFPSMPCSSDSFEYMRQSGYFNLYTEAAAAAASGQADITVKSAAGMYAGQTLTIGAGGSKEQGVILSIAGDVVTLTANLANLQAQDTPVTAVTFAATQPGQIAPQQRLEIERVEGSIKDMITTIPVGHSLLSDATQLKAFIEQEILAAALDQLEFQMLYGPGGSSHVEGIFSNSDVGSLAWSSTPAGTTKAEVLRRAMTMTAVANTPATGIAMGHDDWMDIELEKGTDGHYLFTSMGNTRQASLWLLPVAVSSALNAGDCLVGAFGRAVKLMDRKQTEIKVFEQHADLAARNMLMLRAVARYGMQYPRPQGIIRVSFDAEPA